MKRFNINSGRLQKYKSIAYLFSFSFPYLYQGNATGVTACDLGSVQIQGKNRDHLSLLSLC